MSPEETRMIEAIDRSREKLHKIARRIWEFKEVGWEEFNSSLLLMNELEREGFEVERGLTGRHPKFDQEIDMPTAFKAVFHGKEDGPVVGVLLEYDALPNGHACGHNLISSAGFAAALELKEAFQEKGTVIVYGTPAEELEGSKHYILEGGYMDEVDLMLASHYGSDWGSEVTGKAIVWPTHDNWVTFKGRASHASSSPEKGRSALDAVILTTMGLEFLREHMPETNRIHYIISKGGTAANSVPDLATLNVELRTNDSAELNSLMKRVDNVIKGTALMTDTTPVYRWDAPWYCATPVPTLYRRAALYAADLGIAAFYGLMGVVAAGVLPVDQVAGQPLNVVAEAVLSKPLYYLFMIGGAWMALLTTLNRSIASCTKPLMQACNDGWYPSSLARLHPKFRTPIILLEIYYVIGFVPIMFNFDIGIISDITITVGSITKAMIILSLLRMPKVLPGAWKQSNFHVKDSMLMAIGVLDLIVVVISGVTSSLELPVKLLAANLAVVVFAFVFGSVRFRSGKVKVEKSYELPEEEA